MAEGSEKLGDAYVNILANLNPLETGLSAARSMVGTAMKALAAVAVPVTIGGVLTKALFSWTGEESSIARMINMIDAVGMKTDQVVPKIDALANALMFQTTMTDDSVRSMATQAVQLGVSAENLEAYIKAAVGLGARIGIAPESAMRFIIRASQGNMMMFRRLGIQIDTTKTKQEQFNQVMDFASKGLDVARKETYTLAGAYKQMKNSIGEVFDALGKGWYEKSGLAGEMRKVTATVFGVVDALKKGFEKGTFKGFNFKGVGDVLSEVVVRLTAMLMTLPDVFKILKELFTHPDKLLTVLGEGMVSLGKILITAVVEGFGALRGLFAGLGKILVSVFAEGIAGLPIIGAKVTAHFGREYLNSMSAEDQFKLVSQKTGFSGSYRPGAYNTPSEKKEYGIAVGQFLDTFNDMMPEKMKEMRAKMYSVGLNETMDALPEMVRNVGDLLKVEMTRLNKLIQETTDVDLISQYQQRLSEIRSGMKLASYEMEGKGLWGPLRAKMGAGVQEKVKDNLSISSFSDFWKKAQENAAKDKTMNDIGTNTGRTAEATQQIATDLKAYLNAGTRMSFLYS